MNKTIYVTKISLETYHALLDKGYTVVFSKDKEDKVRFFEVIRDQDNKVISITNA